MSAVFADTAFYVALVNRDDAIHTAALAWAAANTRPIVTPEFVLLEVASFFKRPGGDRRLFAAFVSTIDADSATRVIPADSDHFRRGLVLFAERPDKSGRSQIASRSLS
jgi:predicted nucleic acid-binding protein